MEHDNDNELPRTGAEAKERGLTRYNTGKHCKYGHIADRLVSNHGCLECANLKNKKWAASNDNHVRQKRKEYYAANKETVLANWAAWYAENRDGELVKKRSRYQANRDRELKYARGYRLKNKEKANRAASEWRSNNKQKVKDNWQSWYAEHGKARDAKVRATARGRIDGAMSRGIYEAIKGLKSGRKWESLVGYTLDQLMRHLKKKFLPGMTFENYGRGGWHIDHKIPKAAHNYDSPEHVDFKKCWALKNLQPLWEPDNLSKWAKLEKPFQPSLAIH